MTKEEVIKKIQKLLKLQYNAEKIGSAGVTKKEIDDIIKSQHLDKRVVEELKEYRAKLCRLAMPVFPHRLRTSICR